MRNAELHRVQQDQSQNVGALAHAVNPPDLTFRGFLTCLLCQVVSGLHSRVPVEH